MRLPGAASLWGTRARSILLAILLLLPAVALGATGWVRGAALRNYSYVFFADSNNGWLTTGREIVGTQDGGQTWRIVLGPYGPGLQIIVGIDDLTIFPPTIVVFRDGEKGALHASRDGGATWTVRSLNYWIPGKGVQTTLTSLQFISPNDGWALDEVGRTLWRTRTEGQSWAPLPLPPGIPPGGLATSFFLDTGRGWALRTDRAGYRVLVTTTGAQTWQEAGTVSPPSRTLADRLWFVDALTGWVLERGGPAGGQLHRTTDGGQTWQRSGFGLDPAVQSVYRVQFLDRLQGWAVTNAEEGNVGLILRTTDGGQSWQSLPHPARVPSLNSLWFLTPTEGWVVGERSTILRTTDGGQTWTEIDDDLKATRRTSPLRQRLDRLLGR